MFHLDTPAIWDRLTSTVAGRGALYASSATFASTNPLTAIAPPKPVVASSVSTSNYDIKSSVISSAAISDCMDFKLSGYCAKGDLCKFVHLAPKRYTAPLPAAFPGKVEVKNDPKTFASVASRFDGFDNGLMGGGASMGGRGGHTPAPTMESYRRDGIDLGKNDEV